MIHFKTDVKRSRALIECSRETVSLMVFLVEKKFVQLLALSVRWLYDS